MVSPRFAAPLDKATLWGEDVDLGMGGERAFVSGSISGIGRAIALQLAAGGCDQVAEEALAGLRSVDITADIALGSFI
jgi:hypothetical protein